MKLGDVKDRDILIVIGEGEKVLVEVDEGWGEGLRVSYFGNDQTYRLTDKLLQDCVLFIRDGQDVLSAEIVLLKERIAELEEQLVAARYGERG